MRQERIAQIIAERKFPSASIFYEIFTDGDRFIDQEGINWDFKDQWTYSYSDDYFIGIARLASAFANTVGGIIVFGVHDKKRTGGHNKVHVDLDKLRLSFSNYLTTAPTMELARFQSEKFGDVDALLILPRSTDVTPIRFSATTKYGHSIYIRDVSQIAPAKTDDIPMLYCRAVTEIGGPSKQTIPGSIPPSPRALGKFVGRFDTMDFLFNWLCKSDEPLVYLFGKGGSGKTTIAHEFAQVVQRHGQDIKILGSDNIDVVLFISAKEKSLSSNGAPTIFDHLNDFNDERSLFCAILHFSGLYSRDELDNFSIEKLRNELIVFLDSFSCLIVLDDIDTLTTKGIDIGTNFLYRIISRAKKYTRILCTQRNVATHAISSSKEVPGLSLNGEYEEFVGEYCRRVGVKQPTAKELEQIAKLSERRPLVIECIVGLRKSSESYDMAFRLFEGDTGDNIRDYVFRREWLNLPSGSDSREFLAALAMFEKNVSLDDLKDILQFTDARMLDAVSATRAMFLQIDDSGTEATYTLDALTREFVRKESSNLQRIHVLRARVSNIKKEMFPSIPQISRLSVRVKELVRKRDTSGQSEFARTAWQIVCSDSELPPTLREHPQFLSVQGFVACMQQPPRLEDARSAFTRVMSTKYEPESEFLVSWFNAERGSAVGFKQCVAICDFVLQSRSYTARDKARFAHMKATTFFFHGLALCDQGFGPSGLAAIREAAIIHSLNLRRHIDDNNVRTRDVQDKLSSTLFQYLRRLIEFLPLDEAIRGVSEFVKGGGCIDLVVMHFERIFGSISLKRYADPILHKAQRELNELRDVKTDRSSWVDPKMEGQFKKAIESLLSNVRAEISSRRPR